jgi:hypothetical protein
MEDLGVDGRVTSKWSKLSGCGLNSAVSRQGLVARSCENGIAFHGLLRQLSDYQLFHGFRYAVIPSNSLYCQFVLNTVFRSFPGSATC